jgi:hypothetical protein
LEQDILLPVCTIGHTLSFFLSLTSRSLETSLSSSFEALPLSGLHDSIVPFYGKKTQVLSRRQGILIRGVRHATVPLSCDGR